MLQRGSVSQRTRLCIYSNTCTDTHFHKHRLVDADVCTDTQTSQTSYLLLGTSDGVAGGFVFRRVEVSAHAVNNSR